MQQKGSQAAPFFSLPWFIAMDCVRQTGGRPRKAPATSATSVSTRNSSTRGRAASGETLKKIEPAIETVVRKVYAGQLRPEPGGGVDRETVS